MIRLLADGINFDNLLNPSFKKMISLEFITSLIVMAIVIIFSFIVYFKLKKSDPLEKPKGIVNIAETIVEFGDKQVSELMGCPRYFSNFAGYIIPLCMYIFLGFFIGMMGIPNFIVIGPKSEGYLVNETKLFSTLPSPFTNLTFTLLIGLITVVLIEVTKMRTQKWKYVNQFIFTFPPLLPIVTNFVPMISLGIRLFGNAFAGFCIMTLLYQTFYALFNHFGLILAPVIMPFLHAYFDLFSGFIQTIVFVMITMMDIAQAAPEEEANETIAKAVDMRNAVARKANQD